MCVCLWQERTQCHAHAHNVEKGRSRREKSFLLVLHSGGAPTHIHTYGREEEDFLWEHAVGRFVACVFPMLAGASAVAVIVVVVVGLVTVDMEQRARKESKTSLNR